VAQAAATAQQRVDAGLQLHAPVERQLAPRQSDPFAVGLTRGKFANVATEQKSVAVVVTLEGPDGKVLVSAVAEEQLRYHAGANPAWA
jgi:hypothetical protein